MLFQIVSLADHSGNLRLGMKSDRERENDYQEQFGKNNIKFPKDGANTIRNAGTFVTIAAAKSKVGSWYTIYNTLFSKDAISGSVTGRSYPLRRSAGTPPPSVYIILLFNGSYSTL